MKHFQFIIASFLALALTACSSSPVESQVENTNKIPPTFKGSWQLTHISCASGELGSLANFINTNLNNDSSATKLALTLNKVQNQDVVSVVSSGQVANAAACSYSLNQKWEKTGHWLQVSAPSAIKTGEAAADICESKKSEFVSSPIFKYIVPVGELSLENKNGQMYLYRTLGRSEKDLEICQASDRFVYELKKISE